MTKLRTQFAESTKPFEEFGKVVAEMAMCDLKREDWPEFARLIFNSDWTNFTNIRGDTVVGMNDVLAAGMKAERDHIKFMQSLPAPFTYANHDHSKDYFYILMCSLRFRYANFDTDKYTWLVKFLETIIFRSHYIAERHHPEYEWFVEGGECSLEDVAETAIDRMARNYQFSENGQGDWTTMLKFKPKWINNTDRNAEHYDAVVESNYARIGELWRAFIETARHNSAAQSIQNW